MKSLAIKNNGVLNTECFSGHFSQIRRTVILIPNDKWWRIIDFYSWLIATKGRVGKIDRADIFSIPDTIHQPDSEKTETTKSFTVINVESIIEDVEVLFSIVIVNWQTNKQRIIDKLVVFYEFTIDPYWVPLKIKIDALIAKRKIFWQLSFGQTSIRGNSEKTVFLKWNLLLFEEWFNLSCW